MTRPVLVSCECCGSEGRVYVREDYYDRLYGWQPGERDLGPCEECEGTGGALVPSFPVEPDDGYFSAPVSS